MIRHIHRGAALPAVLFALALASALSVGGLYVARQLSVAASVAQLSAELAPACESLLVDVVATWDSAARSRQPIGQTASLATSETVLKRTSGWITRTSAHDYWIVAEARWQAKPLLRRRLGLLVTADSGRARPTAPLAWMELP